MGRKVLVIGGTGLIGGAAALHLAERGHEVAIVGRRPSVAEGLAKLPLVRGSYLSDEIDDATLARFDTLVFAAANDSRQIPQGADPWEFYRKANTEGVPAFMTRARQAGMDRCVYVGSFYPYVLSQETIDANGYLTGRQQTDLAVRALAAPDFSVCSIATPHIQGYVPGLNVGVLEIAIRYLTGQTGGPGPRFIFPGGTNYMSTRSFSEVIEGAIARGEPGHEYLVGDENLTYQEYFDLIRQALGLPDKVEVRDVDHPVIPNGSFMAPRGGTRPYEPDAKTMADLRYTRGDFKRALADFIPRTAHAMGIAVRA